MLQDLCPEVVSKYCSKNDFSPINGVHAIFPGVTLKPYSISSVMVSTSITAPAGFTSPAGAFFCARF